MMQTHNQFQNLLHPKSLIPQKRAAPDEETDIRDNHSDKRGSSSKMPKGEYETGRIICEVCSKGVSFRDDTTGNFTLKHWDAHRQECISPPQPPTEPVVHTPESTGQTLISPPTKRRRAKRTEDERIEYLRGDPYVARFEAYRVLCASCDKWIRLRPNSTYCSIPWDAHRKSCLSKKLANPNASALEERNSILSRDPDVRKFDAERILCNICDKWLSVNPENHTAALQKWINHRTTCQNTPKYASTSSDQPPTHRNIEVPPLSEQQLALASLPGTSRTPVCTPDSTSPVADDDASRIASPSFGELNPNNFSRESRQKSAEQRATTLRLDPLLGEVEPNRVFCTLCKKWVQLRQDSSYCAYPWLQHRGKCSTRHSRMTQRLPGLAEHRTRATGMQEISQLLDEDEDNWIGDDLNPQRGLHNHAESPQQRPTVQVQRGDSRPGSSRQGKDHELIVEQPTSLRPPTRRLSMNLADLDSSSGRTNFILASIAYLFTTTYDASDDLTVSSLLSYLNAAIPPDKHEDFDTAEVVKAAATLQNRGEIIFEGDILRLHD